MRPSMRASRISRTAWELHWTSLRSSSSLSLSYSYIPLCAHVTYTDRDTCIRIQTKACPVIIALLGYWTPNHEVTTVSNLCSPRSSGIYPCLRLHQCKLFRFPTSEFQPLLAVNTPSFPYPSLWFSTTIFFFFFFFFGTKNFESLLTRFIRRKKMKRDIFPYSFLS